MIWLKIGFGSALEKIEQLLAQPKILVVESLTLSN